MLFHVQDEKARDHMRCCPECIAFVGSSDMSGGRFATGGNEIVAAGPPTHATSLIFMT